MRFSFVYLPAGLFLAGCQVPEPTLPDAPRPVAYSVLEGFELSETKASSVLETIHVLGGSQVADEEGVDAPTVGIEFEDLMNSVERHFPLILAAEEEIEIAEGRLLAAEGGFDTKVKSKNLSEITGFYESDRYDIGFEQPTSLWGATFLGGYRLGEGSFAVYDGGKKTNKDGEFRAGVRLPLLQGRAIDLRRADLWQARIEREQADPVVLQKRLEAMRKAAATYWKWVSAGRLREIDLRLLDLAKNRMENVREAVDKGLLAPIDLVENQRLIVDRESKLIDSQLTLQEAAIAVSLYWRDGAGRPRVPSEEALPYDFPEPRDVAEILVEDDEILAVEQRPEVRTLELEMQRMRLERERAGNTLLPRLDLDLYASQDFGSAANDPDDKGDSEITAFLTLDVPLQRRKAKGKVREIDAKISKLERTAQFAREVIVSEIQEARAVLSQDYLRIAQAAENVRLANEIAEAERFKLRAGESDLLRVNIREQQAASAASSLIKVLQEYFVALTNYRAVIGIPHRALPRMGGPTGSPDSE